MLQAMLLVMLLVLLLLNAKDLTAKIKVDLCAHIILLNVFLGTNALHGMASNTNAQCAVAALHSAFYFAQTLQAVAAVTQLHTAAASTATASITASNNHAPGAAMNWSPR
jgi:hypothetical protein